LIKERGGIKGATPAYEGRSRKKLGANAKRGAFGVRGGLVEERKPPPQSIKQRSRDLSKSDNGGKGGKTFRKRARVGCEGPGGKGVVCP